MPTTALLESLQALRRKVKFFAVGFGVGVAIAATVGLLVATLLLDYEFGLDRLPRLMLILGALIAMGYAVWHWVVRPAMTEVTLGHIAGSIEHTFPQFDDRLRSTVDFARGDVPGSAGMQGRVISQATDMAAGLNLGQVVLARPVWYSAAGAAGAIVALCLLTIVAHREGLLGIALNRLALGGDAWPKAVRIEMEGQVPRRVAVGQRIDLRMRLAKGDKESRRATVLYRYGKGAWQEEVMSRGADGSYAAALDARLDQSKANDNLQVKIEAGDDTKELQVAIVPRLEIAQVEAEVLPPAYVKPRLLSTLNLGERPAVVAVGSDVALRLNFNKPLDAGQSVELRPLKAPDGKDFGKLPAITWDHSAAGVALARFQASESFRFSVHATDADGFQNMGGEEYEVIVREDQPPMVQIEEPRRSEDYLAAASFPIKAVAEDDYGIDGAQLVIHRMGDKNISAKNAWVIDLVKEGQAFALGTSWMPTDSTAEKKRFHLEYEWDLAKLDPAGLKPGDVLEYFIQVKDNYDLNGKQHDWVPSGKLRVTIISREQFDNQVNSAFQQFQKVLDTTRKDQLRAKTDTETLQQGVSQHQKFDDPDKAQAERLANQQSNAASQTDQVADQLKHLGERMEQNKLPPEGQRKTASDVEKELRQVADGPMRDASQALNHAKDAPSDPKAGPEQQSKDASERSDQMKEASQKQQQAADQLQAAMSKLGDFSDLPGMIEKLEHLKEAQEKIDKQFKEDFKGDLGKKPEELTREHQDESKKLSDEQKALSDQLQKALGDMDKRSEQMSKTDPTSSQAMKQAAQMGQQQGLPGKQQQAAQAMEQNQQAQAQKNQNDVEIGIDMILNRLREAEQRKLEELKRQLADVQKLMAELLQRQASHNMDNLLLQGGIDRLAKLADEERKQLWDLSGRDEKTPPSPPQIGQLSASQEQTERNTRDVARQAEQLPDPAPAAKLNAAAGKMERAIVHLRNNKLPDAYDPPQVEALRALVDAKQAVDKAIAEIQKQQDQRTKETIKQAYVKLLEEQKKLDAKTREIDQSPKDENGDLPRAVLLELGKLPGQQGELAGTADEIGKRLASLGSIVYNWANKDIVRSMNEVKDDLGKPETGTPTQAEQKRIEDQIAAMINDLSRKPKNEDFANRGGGGGGNASRTPKMPTDAELRLLKDLQIAVNRSTETIDAQKVKDNQKLLGLGGRQGDLRSLFDQLLKAASGGKTGLDPEPDNKDQLPEEANKEDIENQEFDKGLLNDDLAGDTVDKSVKLTGDRMGRSRQRLAINDDPGKITQEIQKRIVLALDDMIKLAEQQQANAQPKPGQGKPGEKMGPPKPAGAGQQQVAEGQKEHQESGSQAARESSLTQGSTPQADTTKELREKFAEWGGLTARQRQAVQEGASEKPIEKYKTIIDDYYRSLAQEATKR